MNGDAGVWKVKENYLSEYIIISSGFSAFSDHSFRVLHLDEGLENIAMGD